MDKKTINDWIMYYEIQRLLREGCSQNAVAKAINMDPRTVKKYAGMSEADYTAELEKRSIRPRLLNLYEEFIKDKLTQKTSREYFAVEESMVLQRKKIGLSLKAIWQFLVSISCVMQKSPAASAAQVHDAFTYEVPSLLRNPFYYCSCY